MTKTRDNTLRIQPDTVKSDVNPALSYVYFQDNLGRCWRVSIDTRFVDKPEVSIIKLDISHQLFAMWSRLTADGLTTQIAGETLEHIAASEDRKPPEGKDLVGRTVNLLVAKKANYAGMAGYEVQANSVVIILDYDPKDDLYNIKAMHNIRLWIKREEFATQEERSG